MIHPNLLIKTVGNDTLLYVTSYDSTSNNKNSVNNYVYSSIYPTGCNYNTVYLYLETALHVSGGTSTHHQEHIQLHLQHLLFVTLLLLPAASGR
jgi:hypothetical protein